MNTQSRVVSTMVILVYPDSNNDKTFFNFLDFCDTPPNPKSKNHNLDYHTITASRRVMKTSEVIIFIHPAQSRPIPGEPRTYCLKGLECS